MVLQPLQLYLCIQLLMRMSFGLMLGGIVVNIIDEVVVASDDDFVLVGQCIQEGDESVELAPVAILGEVSGVDEDVCFGQFAYGQILVEVVGVAHCEDPYLLCLLHLKLYKSLLKRQPFTIIILISSPLQSKQI